MLNLIEIDLDILSEEIGISKSSIIELLNIYCDEMNDELKEVKSLSSIQDWRGLQRTIHNIKGVSANLFLQDMFLASEKIDLKLKNSSYDDIQDLVQDLLCVFDSVKDSIQRTLTLYSLNSEV